MSAEIVRLPGKKTLPTPEIWDHNWAAAERSLDILRQLGPEMIEDARLAGKGYPGGAGGGGQETDDEGAVPMTSVEAAAASTDALEPVYDAVIAAHEAMSNVIAAASRFRNLQRADPKSARKRENSVEICVKCGEPAPVVHRIDGQPYHASTCYYQVWRANRKVAA